MNASKFPAGSADASSGVPQGTRVEFAHHRIRLDDGHRVGVSVGGRGVPLVFFHGIGLNRHVYLRLVNRLPQLGFLVVALDAPGHGESHAPARGHDTFEQRVAITEQVLDSLGIRRAVLVGHSMGGRTAAELAARRPERALAVILIDPALGEAFDASRSRISSPTKMGLALSAGAVDLFRDRVGLRGSDHLWHTRTFVGILARTAVRPGPFLAAARAIAASERCNRAMGILAEHSTPVVIVHGEKDMLVTLESAVNAACLCGGTLVTLPGAYHSWVLSTPWTFSAIVRQLLSEHRLGIELDRAVTREATCSTPGPSYASDAPVLSMAAPVRVLGPAEPTSARLYHQFKIWDSDSLPERFQSR
jgi:pimeloyl-ACP methyl ester carboxylesterase